MKLFTEQLQDIYYVEKQLVRGLTRMAKAAQSDDLRQAFEDHRGETETQMERLEDIFEMLDRNPKASKCEAMDGLMEEAKELMEDFSDDPALDAALVAAAQKVEHYEIATYGSLRAWAEQLGLEDAASLLEETLEEEKQTDMNLTELAVSLINEEAEEGEEGSSRNGSEMVTAQGGSSGSKRSR
jgi:ferritin-like metal-binding protein YciE